MGASGKLNSLTSGSESKVLSEGAKSGKTGNDNEKASVSFEAFGWRTEGSCPDFTWIVGFCRAVGEGLWVYVLCVWVNVRGWPETFNASQENKVHVASRDEQAHSSPSI